LRTRVFNSILFENPSIQF